MSLRARKPPYLNQLSIVLFGKTHASRSFGDQETAFGLVNSEQEYLSIVFLYPGGADPWHPLIIESMSYEHVDCHFVGDLPLDSRTLG